MAIRLGNSNRPYMQNQFIKKISKNQFVYKTSNISGKKSGTGISLNPLKIQVCKTS